MRVVFFLDSAQFVPYMFLAKARSRLLRATGAQSAAFSPRPLSPFRPEPTDIACPERNRRDAAAPGRSPFACRTEQGVEIFPNRISFATSPNYGFPAFLRGSGDSGPFGARKTPIHRPVCLNLPAAPKTAENCGKPTPAAEKFLNICSKIRTPYICGRCTGLQDGSAPPYHPHPGSGAENRSGTGLRWFLSVR